MRLALVVNRYPVLSETFIVSKAMGLANAGHDVTVFCHSKDSDIEFFGEKVLLGVKRVLLPDVKSLSTMLPGIVNYFSDFLKALSSGDKKRKAFAKLLRSRPIVKGKFDIVHFEFSGVAASYLPILDRLRTSKVVVSCRGSAEKVQPLHDEFRARDLRELCKRADAIHCVSQDMRRTMKRYGMKEENSFVICPSVDAIRFAPEVPRTPIAVRRLQIVSVGRLHFQKAYPYALLALRKLKESGIKFTYRIIGGGDELPHLKFMIDHLGLGDDVHLLGRQGGETVSKEMEQADVLLLPSAYEGIANTALEAMAKELAVVTTTAGGMGEVIRDHENGMIVSTFDPGGMAEKLKILAGDPELRVQLGRKARQTVLKSYTIQSQIEQFDKEYLRLMHN